MAAGGHIIALVLPGMEGVKNISWATNIFPMPLCSVNASPTVHCAPWRHWHPGPVRVRVQGVNTAGSGQREPPGLVLEVLQV